MKKLILALFFAVSSIITNSYATDYVVYEDDPYEVVYDNCDLYDDCDDYLIYDEEPVVYVKPTRYYRPVRETVVVHEPRRVRYVESNPAASIFSGLVGFGLGTAFGAAIAD